MSQEKGSYGKEPYTVWSGSTPFTYRTTRCTEYTERQHRLWFIVLGFNDMSTLVVILSCLPEKGRKEIEEIVAEIKERDREERTGMKVKKQKK